MWNTKDPVRLSEKLLGINLDQWQRDYINTEGNVAVRAGRQSGKSFAQSLRVALFALLHPKTQTLIIGAVDRQSVELFEKVKSHILVLAKKMVKGRPTMHKIELSNGSKIIAQPAGRTGYGLRGYTINKLVVDEAHYVPEEVFTAIRPMMATIRGASMDVLSTPRGNIGFFYDTFMTEGIKESFTTYHVKSEDCPRITAEFLMLEKKRMTKLQYLQEYEALFLDSLQQFFPMSLIEESFGDCNREFVRKTLGCDFAAYGGDQNTFVTMGFVNEKSYLKEFETSEKVEAWKTVQKILELNRKHNYLKIGVDDGGLGRPILDYLLTHDELKRKTIGLNNSTRQIERKRGKKVKSKTLLKEDMYKTFKMGLEQGIIKLPDNEDLVRSLLSIQIEVDPESKKERIHGKYSHIAEGAIRAYWCIKSKGLSVWVHF